MKDNMARLALVLASLELSDGELRALLHRLQRISPEELVEWVIRLRHRSLTILGERKIAEPQIDPPSRSNKDATIGQRVERLLKIEAGLPTTVAFEKLAEMLVQSGLVAERDIPPLSKKALRFWVDRIAQKVPEKEVLRFATVLRNKYVHSPRADWAIGTRAA